MRLALLAMLLLAGCAPALTFRVEPAATQEQRDAVASGIAKWNAVADHEHQMRLDAKGDYRVSFPEHIYADGSDWNGRECTKHTLQDRIVGNETCPVAPSIRVKRALTGVGLYRVMLHELGHALGLRHVDKLGAVMHPDTITVDSPAEPDLTECREHAHACPPRSTP